MKRYLPFLMLLLPLLLVGCGDSEDIPLNSGSKAPVTSPVAATSASLEGKYKVLEKPLQGLSDSTPNMVEFFWFGCPHCYNLDPLVQQFKQDNSGFDFILIPAAPNPRWEIEARLYYAMEQLNVVTSHFSAVFKLYADLREAKRFPSMDELAALMADAGVTTQQLEESMASAAVDEKIARSKRLFDQADLTGVPTLIVNGKYQLDLGGLDPKAFVADFNQTLQALGKME